MQLNTGNIELLSIYCVKGIETTVELWCWSPWGTPNLWCITWTTCKIHDGLHAQHPTPRITECPQSLERWAETETYSDSLVWTPYFPLFTSKNHLFIKINVRREKININDIFYLPPPSSCRYAAAHTAQAFGEFPIERLAICATMLTCRHLACISSWK